MPTATNDTYTAASGEDVYAGRYGPYVPSALVVGFTLTSPNTGTAPFAIGHAFKRGDVPNSSSLAATGVQVSKLAAWDDGSWRTAVVAGTASLTADVPLTITLADGTATGTALTTADLKTAMSGQTCSIDCGAFGTVSWATTDFDSPFRTFVSGPLMSSWQYRKQVGSDAHLVGWIEVRLWSTGAVEVLPHVENGYIYVASPVNKSATYKFTLGSTERCSVAVDLPARCRTPIINGAAVSYWLGTDPEVTARHDVDYLQSTRLVPAYSAIVSPAASIVTGQASTFAPLQQGGFTYPSDAMGGTGYSPSIGLLPEHDVLYLTCTEPDLFNSIQRNGYSAGRYPVHYRDENTNKPPAFGSFPHMVISNSGASTTSDYAATATGTSPPAWDVPHHPSMGFMAHLLTGRLYHLETLQFSATRNALYQPDAVRAETDCVFKSYSGACTTRGAAWAVRTLAQVAAITPASDSLAAQFAASFAANVSFNHATYVAQTNNPFGIVAPYGDAYGTGSDSMTQEAPWQQDFYTAAFGYALAMHPSVTGLSAFFTWKANSAIGRLGGTGATEWLYRDAAAYNYVVGLTDATDSNSVWLDGTGPFPSDWGAMYDATYAIVGSPGSRVDGDLRGSSGSDPTSSTGYWGNLLPAISYAVEHGVSGAETAYNKMVGASNWATFLVDTNSHPVWSVRPPGRPAWRRTMAQWEWKELAGTSLSLTSPTTITGSPYGALVGRMDAWNGIAANGTRLYLAGSGGHTDWAGNDAYSLDLGAGSPGAFVLDREPTAGAYIQQDVAYYDDGRPISSHTYYSLHFDPTRNKLFRMGVASAWGDGNHQFATVDAFDYTTGDWDAAGTWDSFPLTLDYARSMARDASNGNVYVVGPVYLYRWNVADGSITQLAAIPNGGDAAYYRASLVDHVRGKFIVFGDAYDTPTGILVYDIAGNTWDSSKAVSGTGASTVAAASAHAAHYDADADAYIVKTNIGDDVYSIAPITYAVSAITVSGDTPVNAVNGVFQKFVYMPDLGGFSYLPRHSANVFFLAST